MSKIFKIREAWEMILDFPQKDKYYNLSERYVLAWNKSAACNRSALRFNGFFRNDYAELTGIVNCAEHSPEI